MADGSEFFAEVDIKSILSEDAILGCISKYFVNSHPRLELGRGDDCAIFTEGHKICVSSDLFLEDIHFRCRYFSPEELGYKSLAVNISDLSACGAKPIAFNLCLGLPQWVDMHWLHSFFVGMSSLADKYNVILSGGDISRSSNLHISITAFGENLENCGFLSRGGSMPGDCLFVIGKIGLARIGLEVLENQGRAAIESWPAACFAHLRPHPQVEAGIMLARAGFNSRPPALMDISDGIVRDLPRLLGISGELGSPFSNLGANITISENMLNDELISYCHIKNRDPIIEALLGGEDYALMGTCAPDLIPALQSAIPQFILIGNITDSGMLFCNNKNINNLCGFDHFEKQ